MDWMPNRSHLTERYTVGGVMTKAEAEAAGAIFQGSKAGTGTQYRQCWCNRCFERFYVPVGDGKEVSNTRYFRRKLPLCAREPQAGCQPTTPPVPPTATPAVVVPPPAPETGGAAVGDGGGTTALPAPDGDAPAAAEPPAVVPPTDLSVGDLVWYKHRELGWLKVRIDRVDFVGGLEAGGATFVVSAPQVDVIETVRSRLFVQEPTPPVVIEAPPPPPPALEGTHLSHPPWLVVRREVVYMGVHPPELVKLVSVSGSTGLDTPCTIERRTRSGAVETMETTVGELREPPYKDMADLLSDESGATECQHVLIKSVFIERHHRTRADYIYEYKTCAEGRMGQTTGTRLRGCRPSCYLKQAFDDMQRAGDDGGGGYSIMSPPPPPAAPLPPPPASQTAPLRPLHEMVSDLKSEFGVDSDLSTTIVDAACASLGLALEGMSLKQKAAAAWNAIYSPQPPPLPTATSSTLSAEGATAESGPPQGAESLPEGGEEVVAAGADGEVMPGDGDAMDVVAAAEEMQCFQCDIGCAGDTVPSADWVMFGCRHGACSKCVDEHVKVDSRCFECRAQIEQWRRGADAPLMPSGLGEYNRRPIEIHEVDQGDPDAQEQERMRQEQQSGVIDGEVTRPSASDLTQAARAARASRRGAQQISAASASSSDSPVHLGSSAAFNSADTGPDTGRMRDDQAAGSPKNLNAALGEAANETIAEAGADDAAGAMAAAGSSRADAAVALAISEGEDRKTVLDALKRGLSRQEAEDAYWEKCIPGYVPGSFSADSSESADDDRPTAPPPEWDPPASLVARRDKEPHLTIVQYLDDDGWVYELRNYQKERFDSSVSTLKHLANHKGACRHVFDEGDGAIAGETFKRFETDMMDALKKAVLEEPRDRSPNDLNATMTRIQTAVDQVWEGKEDERRKMCRQVENRDRQHQAAAHHEQVDGDLKAACVCTHTLEGASKLYETPWRKKVASAYQKSPNAMNEALKDQPLYVDGPSTDYFKAKVSRLANAANAVHTPPTACTGGDGMDVDMDGVQLSPYETSGIRLIENAIPVEASTVAAIQQSNFDKDGINRDPTRQQTKSGQYEWCKRLMKQQTIVLRDHGHLRTSTTYEGKEKTVMRMRGLLSLETEGYDETAVEPQEGDQEEHTDESVEVLRGMADVDKPLSTMYAVEDGTRLRIKPLDGDWMTIWLKPGDLLVFRGDVCHHGMGYAKKNYRVHAYVYPPGYKPGPSSLHQCS